MHRNPQRFLAAVGVMLALAACADSGDEDDRGVSVNADDDGASVSVDANTAQLALDELTTHVDTTVTGFGGMRAGDAPAAPAAPGETTLSMRCTAGGDARVGGYVNIVPVPVLVDVKVAIQYNGCVTNTGTTIAGDIEFSQTVAAGSTPLRVETIYSGDVVLSGRVNARCPIDLNVLVDETGQSIEIGGTFCGQDASTLDLRISPRWSGQ